MKEMSASEFKAKCLRLLDEVDAEGIVITKRGKAVAKLVPVVPSPGELLGLRPDILVEPGDDHLSTGLVWEAELPSHPVTRAKLIEDRRANRHPQAR